MRVAALLAVALLAAPAAPGPAAADEPVTVFGAASLTDALEEAGRVWHERGGGTVRFSFASSSTLARQIEAGAPAQIFASANERWMDYLAERGRIVAASRVSPIANTLVAIVPADSRTRTAELGPSTDLAALLGPDGRIAVGDPAHVPAGIYAQQALESLGLWAAAEPRLVRTDNVRAALALVERGEAPLGIVYATDARISAGVRVVGTFPPGSHAPITYPFALVDGAGGDTARALLAFLTGPDGIAIFERFGFSRP